jgi:protein SCO1/2
MSRVLISLMLMAAAVTGCRSKGSLPVMGEVGGFRLIAQNGEPFDPAVLRGKIWVADFIFTNCQGPCPRMTTLMRRLQQRAPGVQLVSFTVDPARDTPPVLTEYAQRFQADTRTWHFLTGEAAELHRLSRDVFKLGNVDGQLDHSTRFVLVDQAGRIRGYYSTQEDSPISRLVEDIEHLRNKED